MSEAMVKKSTEIEALSTILLRSLDESIFFTELDKFFQGVVKADQTMIYIVRENGGSRLISKNGKMVKKEKLLEKGVGSSGHVIRTKSAYFSNNIERDPVFAEHKEKDVNRELALPIAHEGNVIGTLHFQVKASDKEFTPQDMLGVANLLNELSSPLANMRMYIAAKHLNESLIKQIESKEEENLKKAQKASPGGTFRIEEKEIIANSEAMKNIIEVADRLAASKANALVKNLVSLVVQVFAKVFSRWQQEEHFSLIILKECRYRLN